MNQFYFASHVLVFDAVGQQVYIVILLRSLLLSNSWKEVVAAIVDDFCVHSGDLGVERVFLLSFMPLLGNRLEYCATKYGTGNGFHHCLAVIRLVSELQEIWSLIENCHELLCRFAHVFFASTTAHFYAFEMFLTNSKEYAI